jgi:hypothetical protein
MVPGTHLVRVRAGTCHSRPRASPAVSVIRPEGGCVARVFCGWASHAALVGTPLRRAGLIVAALAHVVRVVLAATSERFAGGDRGHVAALRADREDEWDR